MRSLMIMSIAVAACLIGVVPVMGAGEAVADVTVPATEYQVQQERLALAQADPRAFLEAALENYQRRIRDYTCVFVKQELLQGKLTKEQHVQVKFREAPFAVFMKWIQNPGMVDRVLYVKGKYDDQALVKPAGFLGWFVPTHVKRPVDSPDGARVSRRRVDQFGFANTMRLIRDVNARAAKADELKFQYKGEGEIDGRKTYIFERRLPEKPQYPDQHLTVQIDQEWLVPIKTLCRDGRGRLLGRYEFRDVKINTGLSWSEFTPKANGL